MKRSPALILCVAVLLVPLSTNAELNKAPVDGIHIIQSLEFKGLQGAARLQNGVVVFSHYDESSDAHNAVLLNPADGSFRNAVAGVPGARFVAEDDRYLVFSERNADADALAVLDKRSGAKVASIPLRQSLQWGHIHKDRLIVLQGGGAYNIKVTAQAYALPSLKPQKSAEIIGGNETAVWGNKIVSIGTRLGIYGSDLREIAVVDMPPRDADTRGTCIAAPLRISGDKAVIAANCGQLIVVDLPSARVERVIRAGASSQFFDIADGLIFTASQDGKEREVRVIELSTGLELARLPIDTDFLATRDNRLLGMKKGEKFGDPVQFTLYEVDFASIKSETSRLARVKNACEAAERSLSRDGDLHGAIEVCEKSGIKGFTDSERVAPELMSVAGTYAIWLTRTLSRYSEGIALLERLVSEQPNEKLAAELAAGRRKAGYLDAPSKNIAPPEGEEPAGVRRITFESGGFADSVAFEGSRVYMARWLCAGKKAGEPGVVLDVLDRATFQMIKRIDIAACDFGQQDSITTIALVPGYVVLGLTHRFPREGRPNAVAIDMKSLEVTAKKALGGDVALLRRWKDKLLACPDPGQPTRRFDPASASLVAATDAESRACAKGDVVALRMSSISANLENTILAETANFRVHRLPGLEASYRITKLKGDAPSPARVTPRQYLEVLPVADHDALVLSFSNGLFRRFALFDIATNKEDLLFELNPQGRPAVTAVWRNFLFVSLGRDLLVYDLKKRMVVRYEKDLVREISGSGIKHIFVDNNRLVASAFEGESSRVVDLPTYLRRLPRQDFFAPQSK